MHNIQAKGKAIAISRVSSHSEKSVNSFRIFSSIVIEVKKSRKGFNSDFSCKANNKKESKESQMGRGMYFYSISRKQESDTLRTARAISSAIISVLDVCNPFKCGTFISKMIVAFHSSLFAIFHSLFLLQFLCFY